MAGTYKHPTHGPINYFDRPGEFHYGPSANLPKPKASKPMDLGGIDPSRLIRSKTPPTHRMY